ncbi:MAG: DUF3108 domain-containing protein [Pseudomonadota bacterium]
MRSKGMPSWRQLALLALLVLAVHLLALKTAPGSFGMKLDPGAATAAFTTRTIEPERPPVPMTPLAPLPPPVPVVKPKPAPQPPPAERPPVLAEAPAATPAVPPEPIAEPESSQLALATPTVQPPLPSASPTVAASTATLPSGQATTLVTAIKLPPSVVLQYKMTGGSKGMNYFASAEMGWRRNSSEYDAYMKVSAMFLGSRSMTSVGSVTEAGLAPTRFADKFRSEQAAHFETDKRKVTFSANTPDAPWVEGTQDRVSVFIQLGGMLAAKPGEFPLGSEITIYTVGPRDADTWTFVVEAEEKLQLPAGEFATLKLTRKPRREYDQKVEIWYAPSLDYLPVRNRITQQNGDFIDQNLSEIIRPL